MSTPLLADRRVSTYVVCTQVHADYTALVPLYAYCHTFMHSFLS